MSYEHLAQVYDDLAYDLPADEWAEYVLSFCKPARAAILEYGCGTGRITEQMLAAGHHVIAIDSSGAMLTEAARKLRRFGARLQLAEADAAQFQAPRPVDLAVCACDVVNYIRTNEQLESFLRNANRNLVPGGKLLFDVSSQFKLEHVLGDEFFYDDGEDETLFWQNEYAPAARLLTMSLTIFRRTGSVYERFDETHIQRAWNDPELRDALLANGFSQVQCYAFGTRMSPVPQTERLQYVASKD